MLIARIFVTCAFVVLALAFLGSTWLLIDDFRGADWRAMVLTHSHMFLFFPTLGILALVAFYTPAVIFTDMYFRRRLTGRWARFSIPRYFLGFGVALGLAVFFARHVDGNSLVLTSHPPRALWEISPRAYAQVASRNSLGIVEVARRPTTEAAASCGGGRLGPCSVADPATVFASIRRESQKRFGFSNIVRSCDPDYLAEVKQDDTATRYCFAVQNWVDTRACCAFQAEFKQRIAFAAREAAELSKVGERNRIAGAEKVFLIAKSFFVFVLLVVAAMLIRWRGVLAEHYPRYRERIARGVLVGALAIAVWPLMDYGYYQTSQVLFGAGDHRAGGIIRHSLIAIPWAVMIVYYFLTEISDWKGLERSGQVLSVLGSIAAAMFASNTLLDICQRFFGAGAPWWLVEVCISATIGGIVYLVYGARSDRRKLREADRAAAARALGLAVPSPDQRLM